MSAILFDRDRVDHLDEIPRRPPRLRGRSSWVDIDRRTDDTVEEVVQAFDLDPGTALSCGRAVFGHLVAMRRRVGVLRRPLVAHRTARGGHAP